MTRLVRLLFVPEARRDKLAGKDTFYRLTSPVYPVFSPSNVSPLARWWAGMWFSTFYRLASHPAVGRPGVKCGGVSWV